MADFHYGEHTLGREHRKHLAIFFAWVGVEVEEGSPRQSRFLTYPDALITALYRRRQYGARVNEDVVAPAEGIAFQEQRGLVDPVNDAVSGDVLGSATEAGKGGEQVGLVNDVA